MCLQSAETITVTIQMRRLRPLWLHSQHMRNNNYCRSLLICLLIAGPLSKGCSHETRAPQNAESKLWIWEYCAIPDLDADAATILVELASMSEGDCNDNRKQIFEVVCRFGRASKNTLRLVEERLPSEDEPFYVFAVDGQRIGGSTMGQIIRCINDALHEIPNTSEQSHVASCLLLFGWQLSRNGEDKVKAAARLALWDRAVDLLVEKYPDQRDRLSDRRTQIREEFVAVRAWSGGEIRHLE